MINESMGEAVLPSVGTCRDISTPDGEETSPLFVSSRPRPLSLSLSPPLSTSTSTSTSTATLKLILKNPLKKILEPSETFSLTPTKEASVGSSLSPTIKISLSGAPMVSSNENMLDSSFNSPPPPVEEKEQASQPRPPVKKKVGRPLGHKVSKRSLMGKPLTPLSSAPRIRRRRALRQTFSETLESIPNGSSKLEAPSSEKQQYATERPKSYSYVSVPISKADPSGEVTKAKRHRKDNINPVNIQKFVKKFRKDACSQDNKEAVRRVLFHPRPSAEVDTRKCKDNDGVSNGDDITSLKANSFPPFHGSQDTREAPFNVPTVSNDSSAPILANSSTSDTNKAGASCFPVVSNVDSPEVKPFINEDQCNSCHGYGHFICCDRCPKSFHWLCLDPPLYPEEMREDTWSCKLCCSRQNRIKDSVEAVSVSPIKDIFRRLCVKINSSNPKTFSLSDEIKKTFFKVSWDPQTGDYMDLDEFTGPSCKPRPDILDLNGNFLPTIPTTFFHVDRHAFLSFFCHCCQRSAVHGPLLNCDFCPLAFHLDCLDPPLASPPASNRKWMCPAHLDHYISTKPRRLNGSTPIIFTHSPYVFHNGDVKIFIDNEPSFEVPESTIVASNLHEGGRMLVRDHQNLVPRPAFSSEPCCLPQPNTDRLTNVVFEIPDASIKSSFCEKVIFDKGSFSDGPNILHLAHALDEFFVDNDE